MTNTLAYFWIHIIFQLHLMDVQVQPKKKFGQNFLVDKQTKTKISLVVAKLLDLYPQANILEIGPGQGDLTELLLVFERPTLSLEIDPEAKLFLDEKFNLRPNLQIYLGDALGILSDVVESGMVSEELSFLNSDFALISSLPYNVGSRILVEFSQWRPELPWLVIIQREVAKKVFVSNRFNLFGAWLNLFYSFKEEATLPPHVFYPQPKVYSSLLMGLPKELQYNWLATKFQRQAALQVLKKIFANPKKTLFNNLANLDWSKNKSQEFFSFYQLELSLRLSWTNYTKILEQIIYFESKL